MGNEPRCTICSGGDLTCFDPIEMTEAEREWRNERAGGNYGAGTKEIQQRNYIAQKELARKRKEMFEDALSDYRAGKVEDALVQACSQLLSSVCVAPPKFMHCRECLMPASKALQWKENTPEMRTAV